MCRQSELTTITILANLLHINLQIPINPDDELYLNRRGPFSRLRAFPFNLEPQKR